MEEFGTGCRPLPLTIVVEFIRLIRFINWCRILLSQAVAIELEISRWGFAFLRPAEGKWTECLEYFGSGV